MSSEIYVEILGEESVILPREGDAGIDLIANTDGTIDYDKHGNIRFIEYGTGVRIAPSSDHVHGFIFPRSSISNYDLILCNSVATIDSSYRGEVKLRFKLLSDSEPVSGKIYQKGDKIGQLIFFQPVTPEIIFVDKFEKSGSVRGEGGFGSTGK